MKENIEISEAEMEELLSLIYSCYGYDFREYSCASLHRRLNRFMDADGFNSFYDLKYNLVNDKIVFNGFLHRITVNVTEMFRDPEFYKALKDSVIPMLASYPIIKIWHAGCSSGEEVFSLAILLSEAGLLNRSRIYATDINPDNIDKAKKAVYPIAFMEEYAVNYKMAGGVNSFSSYYSSKFNYAIIKEELRQNILFSQHNLVTDQVFNEFQLILCRNVMIYFNKNLQNKVTNLFHASLSNFGYLALGIKETLQHCDIANKFEVIGKNEKIYRRVK